jgi:hypothetical protein
MHQTDKKRSLWQKMVWNNCVSDDDKQTYGDAATPSESTVSWYKVEVAMEVALVILMAIPGATSFGLAWLLLFVFMRAWTVRSTRQGHTEQMNHVIYEPHHQMQVLLFSIPWDAAIAWVLAHFVVYIGNLY